MKALINILQIVIKSASPAIKQELRKLIDEFEEKAKRTPNPFDDLLVFVLKSFLDLENM